MPRFARLLRLPKGPGVGADDDVDAEIQSHLDARTRQLAAHGMDPQSARAEALRRFGDLEGTRRAMRASVLRHEKRQHRRDIVGALVQDAAYAIRQLRRTPGFTAAVALTFGLAIGANATMFGVIDRLLLRPPAHVREPDRLGRLYFSAVGEDRQKLSLYEIPFRRFTDLREGASSLVDIAAMEDQDLPLGVGADARTVHAGFVSANFWPLLGVRPALGRFFGADEDRPPDGAAVLVLGYSYWHDALGGDANILGRQLDLGARRFTVIGVAPENFNGVKLRRTDLWVPVTTVRAGNPDLPEDWYAKNNFSWLELVARLRPNVSAAQAEAVLSTIYEQTLGARAANSTPQTRPRVGFGALLEERGPQPGYAARVAKLLAAVAIIVLLVACANVATLLLVRALRRRREIAVRVALGISQGRLVAQLLVEGVLLAGLGALIGLGVAHITGRILHAALLPNVAWGEQVFDGRVLLFTLGTTLVAGLLAGLAPAVQATRADFGAALRATVRDGAYQRSRVRTMLLVGQAALSTTLLIGAGLFVRSLHNANGADLGMDARHLLLVRVDLRGALRPTGGASQLYRQMAERLRGVPGVTHAATTMQIPFAMSNSTTIAVPGIDSVDRFGEFMLNGVGPDYFATVGTQILRGRPLREGDRQGTPLVIVVSNAMANALWPGQDALGKCVKVGGPDFPCSDVVGVAENIHQYDVRPEPALQYWFAESQAQGNNGGAFAVVARVSGNPVAMIPTLRRLLQPLAPGNAYLDVHPVGDALERLVQPWRLGATVFAAFGIVGLCIVILGIYSVLAFMVGQRTQEIGVRVALGARESEIVKLVLSQGLRTALAGVALGLIAALIAGRWIASLLYEVGVADPLVLAGVITTLVAATILASVVPAWRASQVDPAIAMRSD